MTPAIKAFLRGLPISALQACATIAVTRGSLLGVLVASFAINWWWVGNVRATQDGHRWWFASGAACGAVMAVWLFR